MNDRSSIYQRIIDRIRLGLWLLLPLQYPFVSVDTYHAFEEINGSTIFRIFALFNRWHVIIYIHIENTSLIGFFTVVWYK